MTAQETYPSFLRNLLDRAGVDVELIVSALHGVYMGYAVRRFERMVRRHKPAYVLIMLGANDAVPAGRNSSTSPEDFQAALETLVKLCTLANARAIIASPTPRSDTRSSFLLASFAETARSVAEQSELPFVDLFTRLNEERFLNELLPDCQHPNPAANRIIADLVLECLLEIPGIQRTAPREMATPIDGQATEPGAAPLNEFCSHDHTSGSP